MTSKIKVDNITNQSDSNIVNKCGTTITLGASGDTINLASGASQTGFGRTGTVDWQTTPKTTTFTAVNGEGYFVNTSGGAVTANLPAGSAGAIVSFADYTRTFQTNNLTITPNGSEKIGGVAANFVAQTEGQSITLIYVDGTEGWINTAESTGQAGLTAAYICASSPCVATVGDYKIHTFTSPGTFSVNNAGNVLGSNQVDYLVIAGGGGGGYYSGGGGAGGFRESHSTPVSGPYTASPLATPTGITVTAQGYPITVGGGGTGGASPATQANNGSNSLALGITSTGGGGAASGESSCNAGSPGGSGGAGAPGSPSGGGAVGSGNTPPVSPPQGNDAGQSHHEPGVYQLGGGGGGAGAVGETITAPFPGATNAGAGGAGVTTSINNSAVARAGGGGGASDNSPRPGGAGGTGGGGTGGNAPGSGSTAGTANTGGGGGGNRPGNGSSGGSGIVIIRYKFQ
jgi:hypothetical protein